MNNYIMKFVYGKHFIGGLNDNNKADRIVHIDGLELDEFESIIELVAMKVYKKNLINNQNQVDKINTPIVNCYIYDGSGNFITGREVNIIGEEVRTIKYNRDMLEVFGMMRKSR